ncbi:MAG: hypothetical protein QOI63_1938 [Thermoplasmata archaeon]|nr:hypothetical protein [Thermoplasmata archaeon]
MVRLPSRALLLVLLSSLAVLPLPVQAAIPSAPQNLAYDLASNTLSWSAPASDGGSAITAYRVYVRVGSIAAWACQFVAHPPLACADPAHEYDESLVTTGGCASLGNVLSCQPNCYRNRNCYFRVSAVNGSGEGAKSSQVKTIGTPWP